MYRIAVLGLAAVVALSVAVTPRAGAAQTPTPRPHQAQTIADARLTQLRDEFLAHVNQRRATGRADLAAERTKQPPDLRFDPLLNNTAQWFADLAATYEDANPGHADFSHDATQLGGPPEMRDPIQRLRFFGWPANDTNSPGAGTEANLVLIQPNLPVTGGMIADVWMDGNTHYRPFFAYRDKTFGDQDFELVGLGVGISKAGNYWASAIFANPLAPVTRLTADAVAALPDQIVAEFNAARAAAGLPALAVDPQLTDSAQFVARAMAARQGNVPDDEIPDSKYEGGTLNGSASGPSLRDAKAFARSWVEGANADAVQAKFTHVGVAVVLDANGVPYVAVYLGHR